MRMARKSKSNLDQASCLEEYRKKTTKETTRIKVASSCKRDLLRTRFTFQEGTVVGGSHRSLAASCEGAYGDVHLKCSLAASCEGAYGDGICRGQYIHVYIYIYIYIYKYIYIFFLLLLFLFLFFFLVLFCGCFCFLCIFFVLFDKNDFIFLSFLSSVCAALSTSLSFYPYHVFCLLLAFSQHAFVGFFLLSHVWSDGRQQQPVG